MKCVTNTIIILLAIMRYENASISFLLAFSDSIEDVYYTNVEIWCGIFCIKYNIFKCLNNTNYPMIMIQLRTPNQLVLLNCTHLPSTEQISNIWTTWSR